ncbi:ATP synthase subunit C [Bdellovibrio bacteriovorus]|uniref:ATP synthase subunit c n=1 Tax=Bdellovibrio bacteriovorus TaxID=959 RepID=A0A150WQG3_BDEBC|nr:ATP synthase F0 subunit C [Bdellovibrio bacteriovorus]KYG66722.1 ATP synthase subunit C [Bdellovibrio bacteriovorus]
MKKMMLVLATMMVSVSAFAQETVNATVTTNDRGMVAIAAALAIAISVLGGALAQGKTAATALEGIARNPAASGKLLIPMILGLALIESLVIYALIIALGLK